MSVNSLGTARSFFSITPSDTTLFTAGPVRALYVGTSGDVVAVDETGTAVTFTGVLSGAVLPVRCVRVNSTSTTATNIVGLL